jgi:hypothetical protein
MTSHSRLFAACVLSSFLGGAAMFAALHFSLDARADDKKPEKVLKAHRFEIVDENDKVCGCLGYAPGGTTSLIRLSFDDMAPKYSTLLSPMGLTMVNGENKVEIGHFEEGSEKNSITIHNGKEVWKQP